MTSYAASIAQRKIFPTCPDCRWQADKDEVNRLLNEIHPTGELARDATREDLRKRSENLVEKHYPIIEALPQVQLAQPCKLLPAEELNANPSWTAANYGRSMSGAEVVDFYRTYLPEAKARIPI